MARRRKSAACPDTQPDAPLKAEQDAQEPAAEPTRPAIVAALAGLHGRRDAGLAPPRRALPRLHRREGLVVHCTDGRRPGSPEDVPGILRRVQAFHQAPPRWVPVLDEQSRPVLKRDGSPKMRNVGGRGWADAGYHWAVDPWGHVWQLRGWGVIGAHAKTGGHNLKSHGVVVLGDGSDLTDPEAAAILWLVEDARRRFGDQFVKCHGDIPGVSKACPGPAVSQFVRGLGLG